MSESTPTAPVETEPTAAEENRIRLIRVLRQAVATPEIAALPETLQRLLKEAEA